MLFKELFRGANPRAMLRVAVVFAGAVAALSAVVCAPTYAQIVAHPDAAAAMRPQIDATRSGLALVHIAAPTASGVSRNQYGQFDVDKKGAILNNSASAVQTQLGGWVAGNPQLGARPARVIVNEVVSGKPSQLGGYRSIIGGDEVDIKLDKDLDNAGVINAKNKLKIDAENINNSGLIEADKINLKARNDIDDRGGIVDAKSELHAKAGHDVIVTSVTNTASATSGNTTATDTSLGRVGGMFVSGTDASDFISGKEKRYETVPNPAFETDPNAPRTIQRLVIPPPNLTIEAGNKVLADGALFANVSGGGSSIYGANAVEITSLKVGSSQTTAGTPGASAGISSLLFGMGENVQRKFERSRQSRGGCGTQPKRGAFQRT